MAVVPFTPSPSAAPGAQAPGASAAPGQPPIGSSPATQPVPNRGLEAAGLAKLGIVMRLLEQILPLVGAGSEVGGDVLEAMKKLRRHVPADSMSPGIENSALQEIMMKARQMAPQIAAMRAGQPGMAHPPMPMAGGAPMPPPGLAAMMAKQ